jgi:predicted MFS family arabinose efflux permease
MVGLTLVWFGWLIYFGAFAEVVYGVAGGALSLIFLAGGLGEIAGNNVAPLLLRAQPARTVVGWTGSVLASNLLLVGVACASGWSLVPFIMLTSATSAILFLCINILLLDSLPAARGTVMSL